MNYEPKTFDFETMHNYFINYEEKRLYVLKDTMYIKVNMMYDSSRSTFYPIRRKNGEVEYILSSEIFKKRKSIKKAEKTSSEDVVVQTQEESANIRKEKRNQYMREYMAGYLKKYRSEMMKSEMTTHPLENKKGLEILPMDWFLQRIWKRVYRDKSPCNCDDCVRFLNLGWVIEDEQDAIRLYNEQIKYKVGFYEVKEGKW
jgi:hypothetical protein